MARRGAATAAVLVSALFVLLSTAACGRRGDPLPPGSRLPGAPSKLTLSAPDGQLTLSWTAPREDLGGRPVQELAGYAILRGAWPPGSGPCESCPEELFPVARLDSAALRARELSETSWADAEVRPGWTYRYRVQALDARGRPGASSGVAAIRWIPLAAPVVEAVAGDGQATLKLRAQTSEGISPTGTRVYGGTGGGRLAEAAADAQEMIVPSLRNGVPAALQVRAVGRTAEGWEVESRSTPVTLTPTDRTPPFPPSDLVAFAQPGGVELRWLPAGREPYARLIVLRATEEGRLEPLAELPGTELSYVDATASRDAVYRYAVAAVDAVGNQSLPTRETRVRVP